MKKRFWVLAVAGILVLALAAPAAFGAITGNVAKDKDQKFLNQMFNQHQQWLEKAEKDGDVTPEQAKEWQDHFNDMRDFHSKNGFGPMESMMGDDHHNSMMGPDGGMMDGFNSDK